jgi:hypothetical protein
LLCGYMRRDKNREERGGMTATILVTRRAIDCNAIDHEVIDRNEISIVNVHSL